MSTIRVDNLGPSAGGTSYSARGIAKAWVNFNGTGTIAARDSENVSSLTDNGTAYYTVNFTNAFGVADYSFSGSGKANAGGMMVSVASTQVIATSSIGIICLRSDNAIFDPEHMTLIAHGDLA